MPPILVPNPIKSLLAARSIVAFVAAPAAAAPVLVSASALLPLESIRISAEIFPVVGSFVQRIGDSANAAKACSAPLLRRLLHSHAGVSHWDALQQTAHKNTARVRHQLPHKRA